MRGYQVIVQTEGVLANSEFSLRCEICQEFVLCDSTWQDCAAAHNCRTDECPYQACFIGQRSFVETDNGDDEQTQ